MLPEIGKFAILLALSFALIQGVTPIVRPQLFNQRLGMMAAIGQFCFLAIAMLCLIACFLLNDMSVLYVQEHSHQLLPFIYRVGAAWGGHEGSLLLWCLILSGWSVAFVLFSRKAPEFKPIILSTLGFLSVGFILFLFFTSNPFVRIYPIEPLVGDDLTPILQDPGLIFHPPVLYLGYVGFAIGFAFSISALAKGNLDKNWVQACRPWIILPWAFLSWGIVLGSWWAYRELGWGGWWFWDPVENASLLPWLSATALLHTLVVSEKRNTFKGLTLLLAILTFALSLLGTFLVRSGILVSVHAFASDPTRGLFLLIYLALIIGGAFVFYGFRVKYFYKPPNFGLFSRETLLLINSVILLASVSTILLGTLYPIILDALNLGKISVGEPYFNTVFLPIILPLLFLMGFAPHMKWQHQSFKPLLQKLSLSLILAFLLGVIGPKLLGFQFHWLASTGTIFSIWIVIATCHYLWQKKKTNESFNLQQISMVVAHIGIAVLALGITINKSYSEERQVKIQPGEHTSLAGYQFTFENLQDTTGPNYQSVVATFSIHKGNSVQTLSAEQRIYHSHDQTLSKPGILINPWRDIYLALGAPITDTSWSVRIYYKPLVRWIWAGGFMLLLGGLLSLFSKRFK